MGIVAIGRSLVARQGLLAALIIALGVFACINVHSLDSLAIDADHGAVLREAVGSVELTIAIATGIATLLMLAISVPMILGDASQTLRSLAASLDRLAAGDLSIAIDGEGRSDDVGVIARAVRTLRDQALLAKKSAAKAAASLHDQAADMRHRDVDARIERLSADLFGQTQRLGSMSKRLLDAAERVAHAARNANDGSDRITSASSNAAGDVSSVATASEQLLDSIEEISRQVVQSTSVVRAAVERAVETNTGMGRLSTAAQKVGDVISLISRIAAQTNLLALNATIEAARAGEAGRGFAVVAQEVKTLATQTAKATQDITGQIAEMQQATDLSVEAIGKIQHKISEVEHISTIIASAVHEQGAATQEIARNVRSAAAGSAAMSGHIAHVVRSVGETSTSAASVSDLAREIDEIASGMSGIIADFAQSVKAA